MKKSRFTGPLVAALLLLLSMPLWAAFVDYSAQDTTHVFKSIILAGTTRGPITGPEITRVSSSNINVPGLSIAGTALTATGTELNKVAGVTCGAVTASKVLCVDSSRDIATLHAVTIDGNFITGSTTLSEAELQKLDAVTAGTAAASKALVLNSSSQIDSFTVTGNLKTTDGTGTVAGTGVSLTDVGTGAVHKTTFTLSSVSITVTDTGGANGGQGSLKIYDFPEGFIEEMGCTANLTTARGSTGLATNAAVVEAIGTVAPGADATLTSTEADWIASYAGTLSSGAGVWTANGASVLAALDGHTTAKDLLLNVAVPDAGISASDTLVLNGTIVCIWSLTGDF